MAVTTGDDRPLEVLTGWGRTAPSAAHVRRPRAPAELDGAWRAAAASGRGVIARGLGRAYGDAAQNAGGEVVVTTGLDRIVEVDLPGRRARVEAGVSLDRLMRTLVPLGLWPLVTPGTRAVTVGGAIASDVHGKNHHRDGAFGAHVDAIVLDTPARGRVTVGPDRDPEVFWATVGGMGLTGIVVEAVVALRPIETATMRVERQRLGDLDALMARMVEADADAHYSVAWIDCLARGRALGRSVIELGSHAALADLPPTARSRALRFAPATRLAAPPWVPGGLLNRASVAAFNEVWFRRAPAAAEHHLVPAAAFFHPLDAVAGWNRIYGPRGFVQYQLVVPDGAEAALSAAVEAVSSARCASFLAVLKRFGPADPAPLGFPMPGWTLALDVPASTPGLAALLDGLDAVVAAAGGRVYLSKDSRLRPELLEVMYPELPRWRAVRDDLDPDRLLCSDLARRLPLLAPHPGHAPQPGRPGGGA
ncbi:MAG TPA: FAD-binding oxidoreductase [Acidimicrobiales bacterium]|nr:FAD-binding oxidoreductase [Acidimicrobiales bacterium]